MLISCRLLPIFIVTPIASFRRAPILVRTVLVMALAVILGMSQKSLIIANSAENYFGLFIGEFLIGMSLAFSFHTAAAAVNNMGQLIDLQIGFAAASLFDPNTAQMSTPAAKILTLGLMATFFSMNTHHDLLLGFSKLLAILPPGQPFSWNADWIKILGVFYTLGFIVVSPVIICLWFSDVVMSFISRALPQTPVYFVGLPVKIGIGILLLSWFLNQALEPFIRVLTQALSSWDLMFRI